jgi:hypothetical protein
VIKVHHFAPFIPLLLAGMAPAQEAPTVAVAGAVAKPLTLAAADLAKLPRATVTTRNDGLEVVYAGVWLHEVLKAAGVPAGSDLRGKALTLFVVAEAADGYQVVFSLAELDPAMGDHPVTRPTARRCSERRDRFAWLRRRTNGAHAACAC